MAEGEGELWRLAVLVDGTDLSFEQLRSSPMRLLAWLTPPLPAVPPGEDAALAIAKISLLNTFDNVLDYQTKKGVQLRAASAARCRYPHVTLASCRHMESEREIALASLESYLEGQSLERHTGLSRPTSPAILLASSSFLASQGYSHLEMVWAQLTHPLPLSRVVLSGGARGKFPLIPAIIDDAMRELSGLVGRELVVMRQGRAFSLPGRFPTGHQEKRHGEVELLVLETCPVSQGQLTGDTEVVVVPVDEEVSLQPGKSLSLTNLPIRGDSALEESYETKSFTASNYSASDFRNEEEEPTSDPWLEVLTHPELRLHRNYVLVPRWFAKEHELLQYQMVLLEPVGQTLSHTLSEMVISTEKGAGQSGRSHAALLMWYDGQSELEAYLPPPHPGYLYQEPALQCAYIHPHLLFTLFPETLSPSRRFLISVKVSLSLSLSLSHSLTLPHSLSLTLSLSLSHSLTPSTDRERKERW